MTEANVAGRTRLRLPRPVSATLRKFTVYDHAPIIRVDFGSGVFCLAGANGLGKSTFLAALNFGITGIVANPFRGFTSVQDYYRFSIPYSETFFRGRISESDHDTAEVSLELLIGDRRYEITRGMFEPNGLRSIRLWSADGDEIALGLEAATDEARHEAYVACVLEDSGLQSFAQLAFIQHFVLTFDERRHLIFWDERVAQAALFMAFGMELGKARRADQLRRTVEKADSLARNLQWQATSIRKRAELIEQAADSGETDDELSSAHRGLVTELEELNGRLTVASEAMRDAELRFQDESAQQRATVVEYDRLFVSGLAQSRQPLAHPIVATSISSQRCGVCGTEGEGIAAAIRSRAANDRCPLCGSELAALDPEADDEWHRELVTLDERVASHEKQLAELTLALQRRREEVEALVLALAEHQRRLTDYERENERALAQVGAGGTAISEVAATYRSQMAELLDRKKEELDKRNLARQELTQLQRELSVAYARAESEFVPRFAELAHAFLGLDLDLELDLGQTTARLLLTVQSSRRRSPQALSESQRFFVDIALRMALAQQMSAPGYAACLYVDTPEGSLDIAYESRAGAMFAQFVRGGHQLVMTANINTSQLLIRLAQEAGGDLMLLHRMTDWASLSEVQASEEGLFDRAFNQIEAALSGVDA